MSDVSADHGHSHGQEIEHHEHPKVPYIGIFLTLGFLTIVTILVSFVDLGKMGNVLLAMAIASFKGSLVMFFFMHLKYEKKIMYCIAFAPFVLAAILLFALFPDVVYGQYPDPLNPPAPAAHSEHHG